MKNSRAQPALWAALPSDLLMLVLEQLDLECRVAAASTCQGWRAVALQHPDTLWHTVTFATHRDGSRKSELRRLLSLAAWAQRHAASTRVLAISARLPADSQACGLRAAAQAAMAAAGALQELSLEANRGFWPGEWLPRLRSLRSLRLCSKEGGLSLHGDLSPLARLASLVLEARHAVTLSDTVRLPPGIQRVELSCIRDTLPPQLSQLSGLRQLTVRQGLISEGLLLMEHECLAHLTALTSLALEHQEEEAWLPPPELLLLTGLRHLSVAGNDCSRWALHGSDEQFNAMLARMPHLTSLDISGCGLEELPQALLQPRANDGAGSDDEGEDGQQLSGGSGSVLSGSGSEGSSLALAGLTTPHGSPPPASPSVLQPALLVPAPPAALAGVSTPVGLAAAAVAGTAPPAPRAPRLLRLLAHGNQLEASAMNGDPPELLWFPSSVRQLSLDWQVLVQLPLTRLPPRCRHLALVGRDGAMRGMLPSVAQLPALLPRLRCLLLEPAALDALEQQRGAAGGANWQMVGGRWRPGRLPGQPRAALPREQDVLAQLKEAGVEVKAMRRAEQLPALLDGLAASRAGGPAAAAGADGGGPA